MRAILCCIGIVASMIALSAGLAGTAGAGPGENSEHREHGSEHGELGGERNGDDDGVDSSSPILALSETWSGVLRGLSVEMSYDSELNAVVGTIRNETSRRICYVQNKPHLKQGNRTVAELGPQSIGNIDPGAVKETQVYVADSPAAANSTFDGWFIHIDVAKCAGSEPAHHNGDEQEEGDHERNDGDN